MCKGKREPEASLLPREKKNSHRKKKKSRKRNGRLEKPRRRKNGYKKERKGRDRMVLPKRVPCQYPTTVRWGQ